MRRQIIMYAVLSVFLLAVMTCAQASPREIVDSIDLSHWKLQFRGPTDVSYVMLEKGFCNRYFYLDPATKMITFQIDASETGSTSHSQYIRSELREQMVSGSDAENWSVQSGTHILHARFKLAATTLYPNKITVLQIHGYPNKALPLMRIAFENGSLYAHYKNDNDGLSESKILLGQYSDFVDCEVRIENKHLLISVNGVQKVDKNVDFWNWKNYFKAGAYPQSHSGLATVQFASLSVVHQ